MFAWVYLVLFCGLRTLGWGFSRALPLGAASSFSLGVPHLSRLGVPCIELHRNSMVPCKIPTIVTSRRLSDDDYCHAGSHHLSDCDVIKDNCLTVAFHDNHLPTIHTHRPHSIDRRVLSSDRPRQKPQQNESSIEPRNLIENSK